MLLCSSLKMSDQPKESIGSGESRGGKLGDHVYLAKAPTQTTSFPSKIPSIHFCVLDKWDLRGWIKAQVWRCTRWRWRWLGQAKRGKQWFRIFSPMPPKTLEVTKYCLGIATAATLLQESIGPQLEYEYLSLNLQVGFWGQERKIQYPKYVELNAWKIQMLSVLSLYISTFNYASLWQA